METPAKTKADVNVYDVEIFGNIFMVTIKNRLSGEITIYTIGVVSGVEYNDLHQIVDFFTSRGRWFIGYNSLGYDDRIINALISNYRKFEHASPTEIVTFLKELSDDIVVGKNKKSYKWDVPFNRIDIVRLGRKGNMFRPLKLTAVSLKYERIQDLPFHPDHKVTSDQLALLKEYNLDDVEITDQLYEQFRGDIRLRQFISKRYKINVMNDPDSVIADKLLTKMYSEKTGIDERDLKEMRTHRPYVLLGDCIDSKIKFKTKNLQSFLKRLKGTHARQETKFKVKLLIGNTYYTIAKGGIHSDRESEIVEVKPGRTLIDADVASYYPRIMINLKLTPKHLGKHFLDILETITTDRLEQKSLWKTTGDQDAYLAQSSLKITINAIFGKTGFENGWLYDLQTMYSVTLNGQLFLLMLIEKLEMAGIPVFYANTDGITADVPDHKKEEYYHICKQWEAYTGFELEYDEDYKKCILLDVNNYLIIKKDGKTKAKGRLDSNAWKDLSNKKSFDKPIIAKALHEYWVNGIPVEDTIRNHKDIHDFCMAEKVGSTWDKVLYRTLDLTNRKIIQKEVQRTNRYFVTYQSTGGGTLAKYKKETDQKTGKTIEKLSGICAGEYVYLANDMSQVSSDVKPKHEWYIKEARKIINNLEGQLSLFG